MAVFGPETIKNGTSPLVPPCTIAKFFHQEHNNTGNYFLWPVSNVVESAATAGNR